MHTFLKKRRKFIKMFSLTYLLFSFEFKLYKLPYANNAEAWYLKALFDLILKNNRYNNYRHL